MKLALSRPTLLLGTGADAMLASGIRIDRADGRGILKWLVVAVLAFAAACTAPVERKDAPGAYVLEHEGVREVLILNEDQSAEHHWDGPSAGRAATRWSYVGIEDCSSVTLEDYESKIPLLLPIQGTFVSCIDRRLLTGEVVITVSEDQGLFFVKQPPDVETQIRTRIRDAM